MTLEALGPSEPVFHWPLFGGAVAAPHAPARAPEWRGVVSVLAAADELSTYAELDMLLKRAVELSRTSIGLERVGLYLCDPSAARILRGTFGTGAQGETTDERELSFECAAADHEALRRLRTEGAGFLYCDRAPHIALEDHESTVIGHGWVVVTPLVSSGNLVGVMYNDTAFSHAPMDEGKQVRAAVLGSLLAGLILSRRGVSTGRAIPIPAEHSPIVRRVLLALNHDPLLSGKSLARAIGVSSGHLGRLFKAEMGVSLVEYRNRLRIERFFKCVDRVGGNLLDAAMEAGFGSYAQFHRVFCRLVGTTPREYLTGRRRRADHRSASPESRAQAS